jgi:hypothetical protein
MRNRRWRSVGASRLHAEASELIARSIESNYSALYATVWIRNVCSCRVTPSYHPVHTDAIEGGTILAEQRASA